jgi:cytochrome c oxidase cbb3-type subunit 1
MTHDDTDPRVEAGRADRAIVVSKQSVDELIDADPRLVRLVFAYATAATFWLVFGTFVGEYLGLTFLWPDLGVAPWLSFGRLRPVHTNTVFWGWSSLGMLALAHYVVPRTSRTELFSYRLGWLALALINATVLLGNLQLILGVNNGAQEYREYIWPIMALFGMALVLTAVNFYRTIADRETDAIYISNWYVLAAVLWTATLATVAYLPGYQEGIAQTVIQGYYMHQGVGMWFTPMVLGLTYYFLPKLLNRPIYSYALGILAFWTQLLFYTMIGSHHFVFSPIPWWIQTVAIIFSIGMIIPVVAGTANFLLTMRGSWSRIRRSFALPFFAGGIVFYCLGSLQGSAEALRSANLYWHFTNFTVGHSHITMYGFVGFLIWGGLYGLLPRMSGREPSHQLVGAHFWLALVGLILYGVSMSIGGTLQGMTWMSDAPFIESVAAMVLYWTWRGVGGTFMFLAHLVFAYNLYCMWPRSETTESTEATDETTREVDDV